MLTEEEQVRRPFLVPGGMRAAVLPHEALECVQVPPGTDLHGGRLGRRLGLEGDRSRFHHWLRNGLRLRLRSRCFLLRGREVRLPLPQASLSLGELPRTARERPLALRNGVDACLQTALDARGRCYVDRRGTCPERRAPSAAPERDRRRRTGGQPDQAADQKIAFGSRARLLDGVGGVENRSLDTRPEAGPDEW